MLTDEELAKLKTTRNEGEWNAICSAVKTSRGGRYPDDWYKKVVMSGLMHRQASSWGTPERAEIPIIPIDAETLRDLPQER